MKLYIKTYIKDIIISIMITCISIGAIYVFLVLNLHPRLDNGGFLNVLLCMSGPILLIIGITFLVVALTKMKQLKYFLENGIHTKAVITKPYPLRIMTSLLEQEDESLEQKDKSLEQEEESLEIDDEALGSIFSRSIQYQFQNESGQIIAINENTSDKTLKYLCVGSKIHILYDPDDEKKALICTRWDQWMANHELDAYPKFLTDVPTFPIVGKQRN